MRKYPFTINGVTYYIPEIDYNSICDLETFGVKLLSPDISDQISENTNIFIRGFMALATGSKESAGKVIEKAMLSGEEGTKGMDDFSEAMRKALEESGFLASIREKAETMEKQQKAASAIVGQTAEARESMHTESPMMFGLPIE